MATPAQASATPSSISGGISELYLSAVTTNLEKGGYAMVTPFTQTTANGQTIYVASAAKRGRHIRFDVLPSDFVQRREQYPATADTQVH